jgi:A/G-specific adenine glycosylase
VIPFYERFLARFPNVQALASAPEQDVLALWAGLGYYSRARNLQKAARQMVDLHQGRFPRDYEAARGLAGIGEYTAAAVTSIAFGQPHAAVDGNVLRVFTRITNDSSDIGNAAVRKQLAAKALTVLDPKHPGDWNQAVMELGATVCTPKSPQCGACPVQGLCRAHVHGTQNQIPVKLRPDKRVEIELTLLVIRRKRDGAILLRQRDPDGGGQLAGFWELPASVDLPDLAHDRPIEATFTHQITHHRYTYAVATAEWARRLPPEGMEWVDPQRLSSCPLTTATRKALQRI